MKKIWLAFPLLSLLALPTIAQDKQEKEDKEGTPRQAQNSSSPPCKKPPQKTKAPNNPPHFIKA